MNVLPYVYICSLKKKGVKKSARLLPEGQISTSSSMANSQSMLTEINECRVIIKIRILVESDTVKH